MPYFTKDLKTARKPINAGSESVATSGMFKAAFGHRRCLVPAAAYYEWTPKGKRHSPSASWTVIPLLSEGYRRRGLRRMARLCRLLDHHKGGHSSTDPATYAGHHRADRLADMARRD